MANSYSERFEFSKPAVNDYNWADEFYRNTDMQDSILGSLLSPNRVLSGGVCSIVVDKTINVTAGSGLINNEEISWDASQVEGISGTPTLEYVSNWIYVDENGVVYISDVQPVGDYLILYAVDVSQTAVVRLVDVRTMHTEILSRTSFPAFEKIVKTSNTIVAVFVYDTSKDSDGGEWRKRCQHLSWYNESLNTSIRGATREFPAVALIVAEQAILTIYDATDPALPMWMVFGTSTTYAIFRNSAHAISSVFALNGIMVVTTNGGASGAVSFVEFIKDNGYTRDATTNRYFNRTVANRNAFIATSDISFFAAGLVERTCNYVAMTIIDSAPIDAISGLPVPTVAIATNGGVSIIDGPAGVGTVVDQVYSGSSTGMTHVSFDGTRVCWSVENYHGLIFSADISKYTADYSNATIGAHVTNYSGATYWKDASSSSVPSPFPKSTVSAGKVSLRGKFSGSPTDGLAIIKQNDAEPAKGGVANITKSYNSGWMLGAIKGAWLCDGNTNPQLVPNGFFEDDLDGWEVSTQYVSASMFEGLARMTQVNVLGKGYLYRSIVTEIGKVYEVKLDFRRTAHNASVHIGSTAKNDDIVNGATLTTSQVFSATFAAIGTTTWIAVILESYTTVGNYIDIASFTVKEVDVLGKDTTTELLTGWTNLPLSGGIYLYETFVTSGKDITSAINTTGTAYAYSNTLDIQVGDVIEVTATLTTVSGQKPTLYLGDAANSGSAGRLKVLDEGSNTITFLCSGEAYKVLWFNNSAASDFSLTLSCKKVNNVIENGEASSDRIWVKGTGCTISGGKFNWDGTQTTQSNTYQAVAGLTEGTKYLVKFTVSGLTAGQVQVSGHGAASTWRTANGTYTEVLTKVGATERINVSVDADFIGSVDNVEVYFLDVPDRSVNQLHGRIVGQLTKTPVAPNSEMTALSGFSTNNHVKIPYNSVYDFGTGDFFISVWVNLTGSGTRVMVDKRSAALVGFAFYINSSNKLAFYSGGTDIASTPGVYGIANFSVKRSGTALTLHANGAQIHSVTFSGNISATADIVIGAAFDTITPFSGNINLVRIGSYAPTAEQIQFMYEQERRLFNPKAKCLLTDDAVKALAYDDELDLLYVGTTLGIDPISGLVNVGKGSSISGKVNTKKLSANRGMLFGGFTDVAAVSVPKYNLLEEINKVKLDARNDYITIDKVYAGASQTSVVLPIGYIPVRLYDSGVLEAFTMTFDGFKYTAVLGAASAGDVTITMKRV